MSMKILAVSAHTHTYSPLTSESEACTLFAILALSQQLTKLAVCTRANRITFDCSETYTHLHIYIYIYVCVRGNCM